MELKDRKTFANGGMDGDSAPEYVAPNDFISAYNIRVTGTTDSEKGIVTDIDSTEIIAGTRATGINKGIGAAGFTRTRKGYAWIYNSQGYHQLIEIDYDAETETVIFENITDSGGENVLPLDPQFYVNDIKLLHGKYLLFTDGNMEPGYINLERLKSGGYGVLTANDLKLVKAQPLIIPQVEYNDDTSRSTNQLKGKLFYFSEYFTYLDNEDSTLSAYSKRIVPEDEPTSAVGTDVTKDNNLIITVDAGSNRVKTLNIAGQIGGQTVWFLVKSIERADVIAITDTAVDVANQIYEAYDPVTNLYSFAFYNDGNYPNLDVLFTDAQCDYVPLKAEALEILNGSVLGLGGITEGYDRPTITATVSVSAYDPQIQTQQPDPTNDLRVTYQNTRRISGTKNRIITITFGGIAQTGDTLIAQVYDRENPSTVFRYTWTVTISEDGNTAAAVASFAAQIPNSSVSGTTVTFKTDDLILGYADVDLQNAGTGVSKSISSLKTNSAYQVAFAFYDSAGRQFPIATSDNLIVKTQSYAQTQGKPPKIVWTLSGTPPTDAVSYQVLLTKNNTHATTLYVVGLLDNTLSNNDYWTFNINPLLEFNEKNASSVLSYDYSTGDRVTLHKMDNAGTISWFNNPPVDVDVVGFEIDVDTTVTPNITTYLLKVRKSSTIVSADLVGNNILMEIYTPKKRVETVNGVSELSPTLFHEIGERFDIINGAYSTTTGEIVQGDSYFKTRDIANATDLNVINQYLVEDFNFSDYYPSNYNSYGRPRTYNDQKGRIEHIHCIRYSDTALEGTQVNGITRFFAERIYGLDAGQTSSNHGWIRKMVQVDNTLVVIQDTKVGRIPVNISIIEDQIAQDNVAVSDRLLNFIRYSDSGNYGIGTAKESFAQRPDGTIYFIDPNNSLPIRVGRDGTRPIPGKMSKFFLRALHAANEAGLKIIGQYNIVYDEYLVCIEQLGDVVTQFPFSASNWRFLETYTVLPGDITITTLPTKGTVTYNNVTGKATYISNPGVSGSDNFIQTFNVDGTPTTKRTCINITPGDGTPNPFYFLALTGQELSTLLTSNSILVSGVNMPISISITGGEYRINGTGSWLTSANTVGNEDTVEVRQTSSGSYETTTTATLTVGTYSADFNVTTKDISPDPFTFVDQTGLELNTLTESNTVTITGIDTPTAISISGGSGEYSIDGGAFTSVSGLISSGSTVKVRVTTSGSYSTGVSTTLTVGSYSDTFTATTKAPPVGNELMSQSFQKNDCAVGTTGTYVTYTVPADTYFADTQVEANALAQADIDANGQAFANNTANGGTCLAPTINALLTVDMYSDANLDVCAYIDTPGVVESGNIVARNGQNFYAPTDPASSAFMLASDNITDATLKRRFILNIGKLIGLYPDDVAIPEFIFKVRGRTSGSAGLKTGTTQQEYPDVTMIMTGSPGSYIPSTTPTGGPPTVGWSSNVIGGGDGTVGVGVGNVILTITYNRAANSITVTTV